MPEPLRADQSAATQPPAPPVQPTASSADDQTGGLPVPQHSGHDALGFLAPAQGTDELGRLAHYRVLKELGRGGMGCVLLAEDTKLQRQVALKVMLPQFAEDTRAKERFLREARAAAKVHHDNVITIFQVDEANGVPFIALEFLQGAPLDKYLKDKGSLPLPIAVRIVREMAEGLSAAHKQGLIHRDIKPGNVWLEAPKGRVKLLDFGLARTESDDTHLTQSGAIVGTPAFMAPEQARGETVDGRCDLFSLGVVLYRLTTGKQPFAGPTTIAMLTAIAVDTPAPPRSVNPKIPEALEKVIVKLLEKDPEKRYASAKDLITDLNAVLKAQANTVESLTAPIVRVNASRMPKPGGRGSKRWPKILVAAALGFFATVILVWQIVIRIQNKNGSETNASIMARPQRIPPEPAVVKPPQPELTQLAPKFTNSLGMVFAVVPRGKSWLDGGGGKPGTREVEIPQDFYLGMYEVTQGEWQTIMGNNPSHFSRTGLSKSKVNGISDAELKGFPVEAVSWDDAQSFLKLLNARVKEPGWLYRLPTEAEWEYACRGGPISKEDSAFDFYVARPTNDLSSSKANFKLSSGKANFKKGQLKRTTKVGSYPPNRLGIYDMHGNVAEWCQDSEGSDRVFRGGSWRRDAAFCRAAIRRSRAPSDRNDNLGFRLARVPSGEAPAGK